jgi:hypothetical protein
VWHQAAGLVEGVELGLEPYAASLAGRDPVFGPVLGALLDRDNQAPLADWARRAWADPGQASEDARAWAVETAKDAVAYDDWAAGNTTDALLDTLLPDRAADMARAELHFAERLYNDPAAAATEVRNEVVDAEPFDAAWRAGDWGQVAGRVLLPDAAVDAYAQGRPAEAVARWALPPEVVDDVVAGEYGRAVGRVLPDVAITIASSGLGRAEATAARVAGAADDALAATPRLTDDAARVAGEADQVPVLTRAADELPAAGQPVQAVQPAPPAQAPAPVPPAEEELLMPDLTRPPAPPVPEPLTMPDLTRRLTLPPRPELVPLEVPRGTRPY